MDKLAAINELLWQNRRGRNSTAAAKRAVRACKVLGLDEQQTLDVMKTLEFAKHDGTPWGSSVEQVWCIPATV
jgi:hypothetical protein